MDGLRRFGCKVGISDHTLGISVPLAAVALRADVIEKHLTLKRADGGLDSSFSLEPEEFKAMVGGCGQVTEALGKIRYWTKGEGESLRRSLYYAQSLPKGTILENHHIKTARPYLGLSPLRLNSIIGTELKEDVEKNDPVQIK
jgi:sialic acid synthase SpsE